MWEFFMACLFQLWVETGVRRGEERDLVECPFRSVDTVMRMVLHEYPRTFVAGKGIAMGPA